MEFAIPTTKREMYNTLIDIFGYYRSKLLEYDGVVLEEMTLDRLAVEIPDDDALMERARLNTYSAQQKQKREYMDNLNKTLETLENSLSELENGRIIQIDAIEKEFSIAVKNVNLKAINSGTEESGLVFQSITSLEKDKAEKISKVNSSTDIKILKIQSEIAEINNKILDTDNYFADIFQTEIQAEYLNLKDQAIAKQTEIIKYNTGLDEKETKYRNTVKQAQANLLLHYMEIKTKEITNEQLIEIGYCADVLKCVTGYYDTMSPVLAYQDMINEPDLMVYLGANYADFIYMYQMRANNG